MKIETDTALMVAALGVAAALVLMPRRAAAAPGRSAPAPGTSGGTVWDDQATAAYRAQLARETGADWYGP